MTANNLKGTFGYTFFPKESLQQMDLGVFVIVQVCDATHPQSIRAWEQH